MRITYKYRHTDIQCTQIGNLTDSPCGNRTWQSTVHEFAFPRVQLPLEVSREKRITTADFNEQLWLSEDRRVKHTRHTHTQTYIYIYNTYIVGFLQQHIPPNKRPSTVECIMYKQPVQTSLSEPPGPKRETFRRCCG